MLHSPIGSWLKAVAQLRNHSLSQSATHNSVSQASFFFHTSTLIRMLLHSGSAISLAVLNASKNMGPRSGLCRKVS